MEEVRVLQVGMGPLGQKMVRYIGEREGMLVSAAVDLDPSKTGRNIGELCSLGEKTEVCVTDSLKEAFTKGKPDVALLTTVSDIQRILPQIEELAQYGVNIISTCEELSYPWITSPETAGRIDAVAKKYGIAVLATGVNPGFLMDFLPVALTGVCQKVEKIKISRIQNASFRRIPFQQKIGAGLPLEEFEKKRLAGTLRHVGLTESMHMISERMGWKLDRAEDILTPIVAQEEVAMGEKVVQPGMAIGVQQIGKGFREGREIITLVFRASLGEKNPADTIEITGEPDITSTIPGGVNGDIATCAVAINAIRSMMGMASGLKTMVDIPVVSFFNKP